MATGQDNIISFKDVSQSFGENLVLKDMSLDVRRGETLTIIGGSGTGKSVTLKLLLGLLMSDNGFVTFNDKRVDEMDEHALVEMRRQCGMLFQGGALFDSITVGENVAYPLRQHFSYDEATISKIVEEKLEMVGLPGIAAMKPSDLSGGMKKRVGLARAIAADPKVILYDEPTTGLDPANTMRINRLIREIQRKLHVTSVVVTHDMQSAFFVSDRIAMLYNKRIEFVGTPDEARDSPNMVVQNFIQGYIGDDKE